MGWPKLGNLNPPKPSLVSLCSSLAPPQASRSPAQHGDVDSRASPRAFMPITPPQPVSPSALPDSALPRLHHSPPASELHRPPSSPQLRLGQLSFCLHHRLRDPQVSLIPPLLRFCRAPPSLRRRPGLPKPHLHLDTVIQHLCLELSGLRCRSGPPPSWLRMGLHFTQLRHRRSIPRFHPDPQPRLHPGSSLHRLRNGIFL